MKIKPMFRVCFPPSSKETINRCEKGSSMTDTDKEQMANGYISEEQLATNSIYPCPFCGERNFRFYYERKFYIKNDKNQRNGKNPDELTDDSIYSRGLRRRSQKRNGSPKTSGIIKRLLVQLVVVRIGQTSIVKTNMQRFPLSEGIFFS